MRRLHKGRIEIALSLWEDILRNPEVSREEVVTKLEDLYRLQNIEPMRGKTKINIFDKEMATVYLIGKYGLGLGNERSEIYEKVFFIEYLSEKAIDEILNGKDPREVLQRLFRDTSENTVFRVLRLMFTSVILEFGNEDDLIRLIEIFENSFPEYQVRFQGFKKFCIAFMIAERIVIGEVRNRLEKETLKHVLCMKFKASKSAPSDSFIREIAVNVLKAKEFEVNTALKLEKIELT